MNDARKTNETMTTGPRLDPTRRTGLVLCGMGGPDGPDAVEPFLRNLFRDPCILPVPRWLTPVLSRLVARRRAPFVRERYAAISADSATPQLQTTRDQAAALAARLQTAGLDAIPGVAMRYWDPFPAQTVPELLAAEVEQFLVVPAYPHYAGATTGSTLRFVRDEIAARAPGAPVHLINDWHLLPGYLQALADPIVARVRAWAKHEVDPATAGVLYVAHSLPEKFAAQGDPYPAQVMATVEAVHRLVESTLAADSLRPWLAALATGPGPSLAFQSRVGPIKWLGPEITAETGRLGTAGCRRLFVQPISFTCEHVETLHELDIELKKEAEILGVPQFSRGPALNLHDGWLDSLAGKLAQEAFMEEVDHAGRQA